MDEMRLDWLIIGGGIHGVHIAGRLLKEAHVHPERLQIVDPGQRLLARWRTCTQTTGMTNLRSPSVHHLDLDPWALQHFAGARKFTDPHLFAPPYNRPALSLFNAHCEQFIDDCGLGSLHIQARVMRCSVDCDAVMVKLSNGRILRTRQVVLAIGASEQPEWPDWLPNPKHRIYHVFEPKFDKWPCSRERVIVIGGGISAGQVALRLVDEGHQVHLVSRHAFRIHQFDSDPGWLGPKFMSNFRREMDVDRRRSLIIEARHRGSIPPDVHDGLQHAVKQGGLEVHECGIDSVISHERGVSMHLMDGVVIEAQRALLATGFSAQRPGGALIDDLVLSESLPCAHCGYPIVDDGLRWHPRIYVAGPLAELELGPVSRNIAGARRAADRIVKAALAKSSTEMRDVS
ncbi:MAG: FAD/NAD(P)-binding protein [Myxococcota bacterium]|nr:FAD/NAD(P)-binding protein [Myxococcota bacterium]